MMLTRKYAILTVTFFFLPHSDRFGIKDDKFLENKVTIIEAPKVFFSLSRRKENGMSL